MRRFGLAMGIVATLGAASSARAEAFVEGAASRPKPAEPLPDRWIKAADDFFTFGSERKTGLVPTGLFDLGVGPSVGVYFWDDRIAPGNELRVYAATGGVDWLRVTIADRLFIGPRSYVKLRAEGSIRPDQLFYGIGARTLERDRAGYGVKSFDGRVVLHLELSSSAVLDLWMGALTTDFDPDLRCCGAVPLSARVRSSQLSAPPGLDGSTAVREGLRLTFDSKKPSPAPGDGFRFSSDVEHVIDLKNLARRWITYGGAVSGSLDLTGQRRVLSVTAAARFADPLDAGEIPFTELVALGGDQGLRGFLAGRLYGRSAATATVEHRRPIGAFLEGSLTASIGNVFGAHLQDFEPKLCRLSFDLGIHATGARDHAVDLLVGMGTETFLDGTRPSSIRLLIGGAPGF